MGDFNINLLVCQTDTKVSEFYDKLTSLSLLPRITRCSRFSKASGSLIDQIYSNQLESANEMSGLLTTKISDHLLCFTQLHWSVGVANKPTSTIQIRDTSDKAYNNLIVHLGQTLCNTNYIVTNDPQSSYNNFENHLTESIKVYLPSKTVKLNRKKHKISPWITKGILSSINKKDKMYKDILISKTNGNDIAHIEVKKKILKDYQLVLNKCIRQAKAIYYKELFNSCQSIKQTWGHVNNLIGKSKTKRELPDNFKFNGQIISDAKSIANQFNSFFANIGPKLAENITQPQNKTFNMYLKKNVTSEFSFNQVTNEDILKIINQMLKPKNTSGLDGISSNMLKKLSTVISPTLTVLINQSIQCGVFPEKLKIAKVLPLHKKDDKDIFDNYRPISLLSSISKIFERVMFNQINDYFNINKLYYKHQHGFREAHSTDTAAVELIDRIINDIDKQDIPLGVFLDLSKAFDTLDHKILLSKLQHYGLNNNALKLCESYLSNRKQQVEFNGNTLSELTSLTTGVPQGSILGPLFFLLYINDIGHVSDILHPISYADDTTLYTTVDCLKIESIKCKTHINDIINNELTKMSDWLKVNKLSLNAKKTKFMFFHHQNKKPPKLNVMIDNDPIELVNNFNFLGIIIDTSLTWKYHINKLATKLSRNCGIINRIKRFVPNEVLILLYNSLISSHLNYGISLWGYGNCSRIYIIQKRAIRSITCQRYNSHTEPLFKALNILKLEDIRQLNEYKFYYKFINKELPHYHMNNIIREKDNAERRYNTRGSLLLEQPKQRLSSSCKTLRVQTVKNINNGPINITSKAKTHSFEGYVKYIKKCIVDSYKIPCTITNCYICNQHSPQS